MLLKGTEIMEACSGLLLQGDPEKEITGFCIDSRQVKPGDFFVPLRGSREDGHRYIPQALAAGAAGSFYARPVLPAEIPRESLIIGVRDPLKALQQVAGFCRRRFDLPVVGVTGSSGKTTTKDFIAGVLSSRLKVLKTEGNLNNEIGLPLCLTKLEKEHQVAVLEMGMSAPGEIAALARIAAPGIGVITNIGEAHLEHLGSVENIARAKGELLEAVGPSGVAVLNGDDPYLRQMGKRFPGKVFFYGLEQGDIKGMELSYQGESSRFRVRFPNGQEHPFHLSWPGRHLVSNALAALAVGWIFQLEPREMEVGLSASRITGGRLQIRKAANGVKIIDDSYNANPGSVKASLQVLADLAGKRGVAVLGDMLELGPAAAALHYQVGEAAARSGIAALVAVGEMAPEIVEGARKGGLSASASSGHHGALEIL
nr:UDP-N-acetylmuramoyl-tripeptide--D-alanyl-D-alanine ligase [Bacillota bacterium]